MIFLNQILDHSGPKKKKGQSKVTNLNDIRKIIKVFSIIILIFGIVLIGNGSYGIYSNRKNNSEKVVTEPLITLTNNDGKLTITVTHDKNLEKVLYYWDDEEPEEVKIDGQRTYENSDIGLLEGEHDFTVVATDVDGVESTVTEQYFSEDSVDTTDPKIDIITGNPIKVVVTDETALSYVQYSVDKQPVETIYASETDDRKKIEFEIELNSDDSEFTIVAFDTSDNSFTRSNVQVYKRPKIELSAAQDYSMIYVKVTSELGIKRIECDLNGNVSSQDFDNPEEQTEFEFQVQTSEGDNHIKITAYSTKDDVFAEQEGDCTYNP